MKLKTDVESMNKRLKDMEKNYERINNELTNKSNPSIGKSEFDNLMNKVKSLESFTSSLSQSHEIVKNETKKNTNDIIRLENELLGNPKENIPVNINSMIFQDSERIKGRVPKIEAKLDILSR